MRSEDLKLTWTSAPVFLLVTETVYFTTTSAYVPGGPLHEIREKLEESWRSVGAEGAPAIINR